METRSKELRRCDVLTVIGRIDADTAPAFGRALAEITGAGRYKIVVNLKDVTYISSAGLSELIDAQKTCTHLRRGQLVLLHISPRIKEVLELAGLTPLFKVFDDESEAVGSF